ncbi:MAG: hypothetical protein U9N30_08595 [Campylobacterota bacterium]|nr:hypothetical protein [Campylobacterota bacterium]
MNYSKKISTITLLSLMTLSYAHCNNRFENLTYDYFYSDKSTVSVNVKRVIASDPQTSPKVLKILTHDKDTAVWLSAQENLKIKD